MNCVRVVLVMAIRSTLQRRKFQMRLIKKMELHYLEYRALGLIICKQSKLMQYVILFIFFFFFPFYLSNVCQSLFLFTCFFLWIYYFYFSSLFDQVASSLNSSYCYILHSGSTVFTWTGNLTTSDSHELVERLLDLIKV